MQRNTRLTECERELIITSYRQGLSYREITEKYGFSGPTICPLVRGIRKSGDGVKIARAKGRYVLSDEGKLKMHENGIKSCIRSGKYWTKPERCFRDLMIEIGIGTKFPDYIKEIKKLEDDVADRVFYFQYPIQRYVLDFVDIENKVVFNINGDYWHGNPLLYNETNLGKTQIINIRQDKNKRTFLEKHDWKVIDIWESEIYWNKEWVKNKVRAVSLTEEPIVYTDSAGVQLSHCPPDWSETLEKLWFKKDKIKKHKAQKIINTCVHCRKEFETYKLSQKYCGKKCTCDASRKVLRPEKQELETLILSMPMIHIGKKYGVSDNAVRKWARQYGISLV